MAIDATKAERENTAPAPRRDGTRAPGHVLMGQVRVLARLLAASFSLTVALLFWSADSPNKIALANARNLAKTALSASFIALHGGDMRITSEVD